MSNRFLDKFKPTGRRKAVPMRLKAAAPGQASAPLQVPPAHISSASPISLVKSPASFQQVPQQAIAEAAYFLWKQRGGDSVVNWIEAEACLRKSMMS